MKYKEVLDDVLAGEFVKKNRDENYWRIRSDGNWERENGEFCNSPFSWADYLFDTWEVKNKPQEKWRVKTAELKNFKFGDIIVKINSGQYAKPGATMGTNAICSELFDKMPAWFEKVVELDNKPEEIIVW